ncbi:MAG: SDR family oxidoreductase [Solirubrobacteraceae bacterium]|nr:SDR family oxidoreductase [Solirubrobacteraceae bacterium]
MQQAETALYPDLRGRVALVTGGSKGIGAETCRALGRNGARVVVNGRDEAAIEAVVSQIAQDGGQAVGVAADAVSRAGLEELRRKAEESFGPVELLAPFAGGFGSFTPITEISEEEWADVVEWNLTSTFRAIQVFLPPMLERGGGAIVTMASNGARLLDKPLTASYAAAKAGVVQLTRHVAREVGPQGVRLNCVAPATTTSERIERIMDDESQARTAALSPLGRLGVPADTAQATLFLLSGAASWLTGVTLDISGGRVML